MENLDQGPTDNGEIDETVKVFLIESHESLESFVRDILSLEETPDHKTLDSVFRTIHTIKGTSGFLAFPILERLTRDGEHVLANVRKGRLEVGAEVTSALLAMSAGIREILAGIEQTGREPEYDTSEMVAKLGSILERAEKTPEEGTNSQATSTQNAKTAAESGEAGAKTEAGANAAEKPGKAGACETSAPVARHASISEANIRVDVTLLDSLMNLVGELVLARNQIHQFTSTQTDAKFVATSQRLNLITTELQEGVMKTRMQFIGTIWDQFPRVVRDLSNTLGKKIKIKMEGKETELDKTLIEAIKDPLTHLVRNAVDHGLESPDKRLAAGKPEEGTLGLRAYHEGGQVNIEIVDDGAGIDLDAVTAKAIRSGLLTEARAETMSAQELAHLIFLPGLSTAHKVTNVSGRGVGMDVVKTNIEKISGSIDVQTRRGEGSTFKIKIPLTLAIIPALIVVSGKNRYAIPQVSLLELVRLEGKEAEKRIETIDGAPLFRLRGNLLPLVEMDRVLENTTEAAEDSSQEKTVIIVVLQAHDHQFGLVVEAIHDTQEIVVKPLGPQLKNLSAFSGTTILGDGKVVLILDVIGIANQANLAITTRDRKNVEVGEESGQDRGERQTLLVFKIGEDRQMAVPLSAVARLEEFPIGAVEKMAQFDAVQYRDEILPLIHLPRFFGICDPSSENTDGQLQVIVYNNQASKVGLVVDRILDIVEENIEVDRTARRAGLLGSAVVKGKITELVDLEDVLLAENISLAPESSPTPAGV